MGSDLVVPDAHGEALDIPSATTERLAQAISDIGDARDRLRELEALVGGELLTRLDRDACWTLRVGDPTGDVQYEMKAPSPEAGTESYPEHELEPVLRLLLDAGSISTDAATSALKRSLAVEFSVPWDAAPEEIADGLEGATIQIAGHEVMVLSVKPQRKAVKAGIIKLRKIPGVAEYVDEAKRTETPERKVKVTAIRREARKAVSA